MTIYLQSNFPKSSLCKHPPCLSQCQCKHKKTISSTHFADEPQVHGKRNKKLGPLTEFHFSRKLDFSTISTTFAELFRNPLNDTTHVLRIIPSVSIRNAIDTR